MRIDKSQNAVLNLTLVDVLLAVILDMADIYGFVRCERSRNRNRNRNRLRDLERLRFQNNRILVIAGGLDVACIGLSCRNFAIHRRNIQRQSLAAIVCNRNVLDRNINIRLYDNRNGIGLLNLNIRIFQFGLCFLIGDAILIGQIGNLCADLAAFDLDGRVCKRIRQFTRNCLFFLCLGRIVRNVVLGLGCRRGNLCSRETRYSFRS